MKPWATPPRTLAFVETVARRGYRFIADVKVADAAPAPTSAPQPRLTPQPTLAERQGSLGALRDPRRSPAASCVAISTVILLAMLAAFATWSFVPATRLPGLRSAGRASDGNLSSEASQDYFADGMTDELIADLGRISALRVIRAHR